MLCAFRELEEETGFRVESPDSLEYLMSLTTTVAFCDEAIDIFVAHNLIPSHQNLDEDEVINVEPCELADLEEMVYTGKITDGKTIAAIMAYARKYRSVDKRTTWHNGRLPEYSSLEIFMGRMTAVGLRRLRLGLATLTYQDWLLSCFVLGVLAGTAAALAFGGPVVQGCVLGAAGTAGTVGAGDGMP